MGRSMLNLAQILDAPEYFTVPSLESVDFSKTLENYVIVLEGLEVCADKMGVYNASGQSGDATTAKELKGDAIKWVHAADALSEGETALRTDDIVDTLSWESIGLEAAASDKNIFRRIWDAIVKVSKAIWDFIYDFIFGVEHATGRLDRAASSLSVMSHECSGKKASVASIALSAIELKYFNHSGSAPRSADDVSTLLLRTEEAFHTLLDDYLTTIDRSTKDVKEVVTAAFENNFDNAAKNADLMRAVSVCDIKTIADKISTLTPGTAKNGMIVRSGPQLLDNQKLSFMWDAANPSGKASDEKKISARTNLTTNLSMHNAGRISLQSYGAVVAGGQHLLPVMALHEVDYILKLAKEVTVITKAVKDRVEKLREHFRELDATIERCIRTAESHPENYNKATANILATLGTGNLKRVAGPVIELQKLLVSGAKHALVLCHTHLKVYQ